jgi:hypothetical protein
MAAHSRVDIVPNDIELLDAISKTTAHFHAMYVYAYDYRFYIGLENELIAFYPGLA